MLAVTRDQSLESAKERGRQTQVNSNYMYLNGYYTHPYNVLKIHTCMCFELVLTVCVQEQNKLRGINKCDYREALNICIFKTKSNVCRRYNESKEVRMKIIKQA